MLMWLVALIWMGRMATVAGLSVPLECNNVDLSNIDRTFVFYDQAGTVYCYSKLKDALVEQWLSNDPAKPNMMNLNRVEAVKTCAGFNGGYMLQFYSDDVREFFTNQVKEEDVNMSLGLNVTGYGDGAAIRWDDGHPERGFRQNFTVSSGVAYYSGEVTRTHIFLDQARFTYYVTHLLPQNPRVAVYCQFKGVATTAGPTSTTSGSMSDTTGGQMKGAW